MTKEPTPLAKKSDGLSLMEAARQLGVHWQSMYAWVRDGKVPVTRFGPGRGVARIHPADLEALRHDPGAARPPDDN